MKKIFTSIVILTVFFGGKQLLAQAPRTVLFEEFTSATCPPCAATNPIFRSLLEPYGSRVINLSFQCNIPSAGDPMYASNTTDVNTRMTYYGINSAPNCRMDGQIAGVIDPNTGLHSTHPLGYNNAILDSRVAMSSPIELSVDHIVILGVGGAKDSMNITINIKNVSGVDFSNKNYVLQTCIIEDLIKFPKQAATNGETEFDVVMRKMLPSAAGTKLLDTIAPGATKTITMKVPVPTYIYSYKELGVVAYVQNNTASSKEVIQAALSKAKAVNGVYYDIALNSGTISGKVDDCDNTIIYNIELENLSTGTDTIKTIDLIPIIGGSKKPRSTWKGVLLPGGKTTYKISSTLNYGISTYNVYIDTINSGKIKDINAVNNFQGQNTFTTFNSAVQGTNLNQGFEVATGNAAPAKTYFFSNGPRVLRFDAVAFNNLPYPIGGFGQSRYCVFFGFSDGGIAGGTGSVIFDKLDLTSSKSTKLYWNYAYAVKDANSSDMMEVLVSKDCGANWESVFENQGDAMKSCDPDISKSFIPNFFVPLVTEWRKEVVDLSAYDGTPELMIQFKGTAGNGWEYLLDDVNVNSAVATNDPGILQTMSVFPNPSTDNLNIKLNSTENASAIISLSDMNGRKVSSFNKSIIAGQNQISIPVSQIT
ncbi:MAG: T9SS type A sorting domain-containing protein, partial [Saprospiraceae bacterium]